VSEPVVQVRGLWKAYPGVVAVAGVDFDVRPGEVVGLVGKNGAGKSTLIKILAGAEKPDEGEVRIGGEPVPSHYDPHLAHQLGLAFMHQEFANVPQLTVAENVSLGTHYPRRLGALVGWRQLREDVREVLAGLDPTIDVRRRVADLSSVQQRIVMIARALYHRARVLVFDEPSASLTVEEIRHLHDVIGKLRDGGRSVIYVSHRLGEIFSITDRVVVIRDGRVALESQTAQLDHGLLIAAIVGSETQIGVPGRRRRERTTAPGEPVLTVRGLTRPGVVENVSLELRAGEILGLGGLIGSGRTELVRMIFGADRAAGGTVELRGRPARIRSPRDAIASGIVLLPEDRRHQALVSNFSVRANITLPSLARHRIGSLPVPSRASEARSARELVARLSIKTSGIEQPVSLLSGGNQQKVVLAKWLEQPVDVFIFDEATQGIDVHAKEETFSLMEDLASRGKGVVFIASDFSELVAVCDRVVVLHEGRVSGVLDGDEITEQAIAQHSYGLARSA
jgi:ABC-type sugar transport system ATPase subunit